MQDSEICPKCKSTQVIKHVRLVDRGHGDSRKDLSVEIYEKPEALIFKGTHKGPLNAWVCGSCGFTELYVANAEELWRVYESLRR